MNSFRDVVAPPQAPPLDTAWVQQWFGDSPDLVAVVAPDGTLLACNRAPAAGRGLITDYFAPESGAELRLGLARACGSRRSLRIELAGPRTDGTRGWHLVTLSPVLHDGVLRAVNLVASDVTERRREEERLRRAEALMADTQGAAQLGTWEWDISESHAVWSAELYRIYGLDPAQHLPTYADYLTRVHPEDRQRVVDATNSVFHHRRPYSHDERVYRSDGTLRYLHTWAMPVLDESGALIRLMGVCQDITDRKLAEIALEAHAAELGRSNAELEQFARLASHDLQEPLRAVGGFVQLLARRFAGQLDAEADEAIGFAVGGVQRMKALLEALLAYSRITAQPGVPAPVDVAATLAHALDRLQPAIADSGARITHLTLPPVMGDAPQIAALLQNLIDNAIKFRGSEPPRIELEGYRRGDTCEFVLRDNGIGIGEEHFSRIFLVFQRLHADLPGTGIGLAICRKIVERHGGRIWVESAPGRGSAFRFTLPAAPAATQS